MKGFRAKWEYVSNNGLLVALIVFIISGAGGIVVVLKRASVWFWTDAHISWGGVLVWALASLAGLGVIQGLAAELRRVMHDLARRIALEQQANMPSRAHIARTNVIPDTFKLGAPIRRAALATLLAQYGSLISLDELRRSIQAAPGVNMTVAARAKLAREMDAAARANVVTITNGDEYALTPEGRDWMLDRLNQTGTSGDTISTQPRGQSTPGPGLPEPVKAIGAPGPTLPTAGVAEPTPSVAPTIMTGVSVPKPVELTDTEAAVLKWCGHQWQPGVPVGIARGALEMGMSALQVAQAADGLHSKGLVSKAGPNGVLLTPSGRDLCAERGWHGGLEARRRRDPRSPF